MALGIRACLAGQRVVLKTATEWVALLADAQRSGRLNAERDRLQRIPLLIVDEVAAAAMSDGLVHHAEILALEGDSYRLKDRDRAPPATPATEARRRASGGHLSPGARSLAGSLFDGLDTGFGSDAYRP